MNWSNFVFRPAPSTPQSTGITRSSTYEKLPKTTSSSKPPAKGSSPNTGASFKSKRPLSSVAKIPAKRFPSAPTKPSGGPRIVKPVPKPNAITSRTLRQSGSFCPPFSETRSYSLSSGPPTCISSGRSYEDSRVSIPLVTGPFAPSSEERKVDISCNEDTDAQSRNDSCTNNRNDSDDSESAGDRWTFNNFLIQSL